MAKSNLVSSNVGDAPQQSLMNDVASKDVCELFTDGTFSITLRKRENHAGYRPYIVIASSHDVVAKIDNDGRVRGCSFFTNKEHMLPGKHVEIAQNVWKACEKRTNIELIMKQISTIPGIAGNNEVLNFNSANLSEPVVMHRKTAYAI